MKKTYVAPNLEIELYELNASIASNCALVVQMGPQGPGAIEVCDDYYAKTGESRDPSTAALYSLPHNVQFWSEETCDCYYSAGAGCFTS